MKLKLICILLLTALPEIAWSQSTWGILPNVKPWGKLDIVSDSVFVILFPQLSVSTNRGQDWTDHPLPYQKSSFNGGGNAYFFRGLHFENAARGFVYGNLEFDPRHLEYYLLQISTADSGKHWDIPSSTDLRNDAILDLFARTERSWFYGAKGVEYNVAGLAQSVWDKTGRLLFNFPHGPEYAWALDAENNIVVCLVDEFSKIALLKSSDTGHSWTRAVDSLGTDFNDWNMTPKVLSITPALWYVSFRNFLFRSVDSGNTWQKWKTFSSDIADMAFYHTGLGYLTFKGVDSIFKTTDSGAFWSAQHLPTTDLQNITIINDSIAYIQGDSTVLRTPPIVKSRVSSEVSMEEFGITVLDGLEGNSRVLEIKQKESGPVDISISDLIGREYSRTRTMQRVYRMITPLHSGLYIIIATNSKGQQAFAKLIVN